MKQIAAFILVFLVSGCSHQYIKNPEDFKPEFVVELPGIEKDYIHSKVSEWYAINWLTLHETVLFNDKKQGVFIVRGESYDPSDFTFDSYYFTARIEAKDGKFRYKEQDFRWTDGWSVVARKDAIDNIKIRAENTADMIKDYIEEQHADSNW